MYLLKGHFVELPNQRMCAVAQIDSSEEFFFFFNNMIEDDEED